MANTVIIRVNSGTCVPHSSSAANCEAPAKTSALIARITEAGKAVVLDMEEVTFVASAFLRICIMAAKIASPATRWVNTASIPVMSISFGDTRSRPST